MTKHIEGEQTEAREQVAPDAAAAEVDRLAGLATQIEYEQQREPAAERLGIKAPRLDILVKAAKRKKLTCDQPKRRTM